MLVQISRMQQNFVNQVETFRKNDELLSTKDNKESEKLVIGAFFALERPKTKF